MIAAAWTEEKVRFSSVSGRFFYIFVADAPFILLRLGNCKLVCIALGFCVYLSLAGHVLHVLLKFHTDMKKNIFAVAAVAAMLCACGGGQQKSGDMPEQDGSRTGYALAFFRNAAALSGADENMMVSPYSAGVALSMLADGAEDETRAELLRALGGSVFSGDILHADSLTDVRSANSAWIRSGFDVKDSYVALLRESYGAMVAEKDFSSGSTVGEINRWCSDNTEGRITEIIDRISPDMVMFLVNAL